MARRDLLHDACKNALIKAGWTITHDPYPLRRGRQLLYIDLGAEMPMAAEKDGRKIAVEVKSLLGTVDMPELERALYLAVSNAAYAEHFDTLEGHDLIADETLRLLVFQPIREEIVQWIE